MVNRRLLNGLKHFGMATNALVDMFIVKIVDFGIYSPVYRNSVKADLIAVADLFDVTMCRYSCIFISSIFFYIFDLQNYNSIIHQMQKQYFLLTAALMLFACKHEPLIFEQQNRLKMNETQVIASHNSFRLHTYQRVYDFVLQIQSLLSGYNPEEWDYTHIPIPEQLQDYGIRGVELDIYNDPQGGHFANRACLQYLQNPEEPIASGIPELDVPGMKVLHIPDVDYMTNYYSFVSALQAIKTWSDAHPNHLPIYINVESKTETVSDQITLPDFVTGIPFDASAWDALDAEVKSVFGDDLENVITPDKIRSSYPTLKDAILAGNWLTLKEARGKVIFILDGGKDYEIGHPSLEGRTMFVYQDDDTNDEAAFIIKNDPTKYLEEIKEWVNKGYIVRTRSDASVSYAQTGDYTDMIAAFQSGAQLISTDYYRPDPRYLIEPNNWTNYQVFLPDHAIGRANPILTSAPYKGNLTE